MSPSCGAVSTHKKYFWLCIGFPPFLEHFMAHISFQSFMVQYTDKQFLKIHLQKTNMQFFSVSNWLFSKTFWELRLSLLSHCSNKIDFQSNFQCIQCIHIKYRHNLRNFMKRIDLGHVLKIVWTRTTEKEHHLFLSPIFHDMGSIATVQYQFRRLWMTLIAFLLTAKSCSSEVFHTVNRQSGWQWKKKSISQSAGNGISKTTAGVSQYDKCGIWQTESLVIWHYFSLLHCVPEQAHYIALLSDCFIDNMPHILRAKLCAKTDNHVSWSGQVN